MSRNGDYSANPKRHEPQPRLWLENQAAVVPIARKRCGIKPQLRSWREVKSAQAAIALVARTHNSARHNRTHSAKSNRHQAAVALRTQNQNGASRNRAYSVTS
eukprot:gene13940-biopygen574